MKLAVLAAIATLPLFVVPASAGTLTLDFENVTSFASIDTFYAGGTDGAGNAGPALGVTFGLDALGLQNDALGPYFSGAPSPLGVMAPVGAASTLDMPEGFLGLSFYYSSLVAVTDAVEVWSGLGGTGTLLASLSLAANAQDGGCSGSPLCHFDLLTTTLGGLAHSVTFGNAATAAVFDDVALAVPEPAGALLVALGLAGVAVRRRR